MLPVPARTPAPRPEIPELVEDFLRGLKPTTRRAYAGDLDRFAGWLDTDRNEAVRRLLTSGPGAANLMAIRFRDAMIEEGLSASTVNRRLAALRSVVRLARTAGLLTWMLEVSGLRSRSYRDTSGPGRDGVRAMLELLRGRDDTKAHRDRSIVRLLFECGLRRGEVASLRLEDVDEDAVWVLGKGQNERVRVTLPAPTSKALTAWIHARGDEPGPLFYAYARGERSGPLTGKTVWRLVRALGRKVGIEVRPHGLRHAGITAALDVTGGDVRAVQRFSRHANMQTVTCYDDNRSDLGGEVARRIAIEE